MTHISRKFNREQHDKAKECLVVGRIYGIYSRGMYRTAELVKIGKKNAHFEYTTESAIREANKTNEAYRRRDDWTEYLKKRHGEGWTATPNITRKTVPLTEVYEVEQS